MCVCVAQDSASLDLPGVSPRTPAQRCDCAASFATAARLGERLPSSTASSSAAARLSEHRRRDYGKSWQRRWEGPATISHTRAGPPEARRRSCQGGCCFLSGSAGWAATLLGLCCLSCSHEFRYECEMFQVWDAKGGQRTPERTSKTSTDPLDLKRGPNSTCWTAF